MRHPVFVSALPTVWTRRAWLQRHVAIALVAVPLSDFPRRALPSRAVRRRRADERNQLPKGGPDDRAVLAQRAVAAAMHAGAHYADARLTCTEHHRYAFDDPRGLQDYEWVGIGVRALVNGYWGFTACPSGEAASVERLGQEATAQAQVNARDGGARTVDLGQISPATGQWVTPVQIDPFSISIEEKHAFMDYWQACARRAGLSIVSGQSHIGFTRQERVVATSEGAHFTQTVFESGGEILVQDSHRTTLPIQGIATTGRGWELFLTDARISEQLQAMPERLQALLALQSTARPGVVGRYTLVCDGATMAALLSATLGVATQLDRALGYEADAGGTSFLDDPLGMLGTFSVASPLVTVTANRSMPTQLATVKWDDEGVVPPEVTLIKEGVLHDFQTTREQAAWLAPYYEKHNRPVRSNGCAAAESALTIPMQHMPNLSLEPGTSTLQVADLVANVRTGLLLEAGTVMQVDAQARNGLLYSSQVREIRNGKLGVAVNAAGGIMFNTLELWKHITAIGGPSTRMVVPFSCYPWGGREEELQQRPAKGQPPQIVSYSTQAVAATITNQPLINVEQRA